MAERLKNTLQFTNLAPGASVALPHGLHTSLGRPLAPDIIYIPSEALMVVSDKTNVTLTNNGSVPLSGTVLVESWHTIERAFNDVNQENLPVKPYIVVSVQQGNQPVSPACVNHPNDAAIAALNGDQAFWANDMRDHNEFQQFGGSPFPDGIAPGAWLSPGPFPGTWSGDSGKLKDNWANWIATLPGGNQNDLWNLIADTQMYFNAQLAAQNAGNWVSWLAPSIIEHILEETLYFKQAVFGFATSYSPPFTPRVWTPQELRTIWVEWQADHAVNISHFIDPQQTEYVNEAVAFHNTFTEQRTEASLQTVGCACGLDPLIIEASTNWNAFLTDLNIGTPQNVPSVLYPTIIKHLKDEGDICKQIVALLNCGPP